MKKTDEIIQQLKEDYLRRIDTIDKMLSDLPDEVTKQRLLTKKGCFKSFVIELDKILNNDS